MNDKELLEYAAKAAGIKIDKSETNGGGKENTGFDIVGNAVLDWHSMTTWNPLTDDGDSLRLAVKLRLRIDTPSKFSRAIAHSQDLKRGVCENSGHDLLNDPHEDTRRAIVMAAAEIGKAMK